MCTVLYTIELWMVPILLLPRILSCDKNVAALKAPLLVSVLFLLSCECAHSASFGAQQGMDLISYANILSRTPPILGLT